MRSVLTVAASAALAMALLAAPAEAQDEQPPPEVNCYPLLSSLVCEVPVTIGPFNFDVDVPIEIDSIFPAPSS